MTTSLPSVPTQSRDHPTFQNRCSEARRLLACRSTGLLLFSLGPHPLPDGREPTTTFRSSSGRTAFGRTNPHAVLLPQCQGMLLSGLRHSPTVRSAAHHRTPGNQAMPSAIKLVTALACTTLEPVTLPLPLQPSLFSWLRYRLLTPA